MLSASGVSAYQIALGSNPADLFGREDGGEDMMFAQDTALAGQFVNQWKIRAEAQEATRAVIANNKLRWLLAFNKTFNCAEIDVGDMALFHKAQNRESSFIRRRTGRTGRALP